MFPTEYFPNLFQYRNHYETAPFTSFKYCVPFVNYMVAFYCNLLPKGGNRELKLMPGWNNSQNTITRKRDPDVLKKTNKKKT